MKNQFYLLIVLALVAAIHPAIARLPLISSFSQNGLLVCTNLNPGSIATVAWAPSLDGPWQTNLPGLNAVIVGSDQTIQVTVPMTNPASMFYCVIGIPVPSTITSDGMALIPAGSFTMGDTLDGEPDAHPTNVYISAFYMDTNVVSYTQWQSVFAYATNNNYTFDNPGAGKAANHPVQTINWYDAVKWSNARSQQAGLIPVYFTDIALTQIYTNGDVAPYVNWTNSGYRLPTEAEWEKAARGGLSGQRFPSGLTISENQANYMAATNIYSWDLGPYDGNNINFDGGALPYTSPVGYFPANGYGLNDMAGNVQEWCWDWYNASSAQYGQPTTNNPTGVSFSPQNYRILRGGFWNFYAYFARCANRGYNPPNTANTYMGFRCVKVP